MKEKVLAYGSPIPEDYRHVLVPGLGYDYVCAKCGDFGTPAELYGLRCKKVYALFCRLFIAALNESRKILSGLVIPS